MKIVEMRMKNFGNYNNTIVKMKAIMFLLKENGAGKSTFLKALNYALDGDFEDSMIKNGTDEMSVSITLENGFHVVRGKKGSRAFSKIGYQELKTVTKEKANEEIARIFGLPMASIKVIASSNELFEMKPEYLADFIMRHIPNKMNVENILSYIPDASEEMKEEILKVFPQSEEFGSDMLEAAYERFDECRKNVAAEYRNLAARLDGYDFEEQMRPVDEVQKEFNELMKQIGAIEEKEKSRKEYERQKKVRDDILRKLNSVKEEFNAIKATKPDKKEEDFLAEKEEDLQKQVLSLSQTKEAMQISVDSIQRVIDSLRKGMCPQIADTPCPKDWSQKISSLEAEQKTIIKNLSKLTDQIKKSTAETIETAKKRKTLQENRINYMKKTAKYEEYNSLKSSLFKLPQEPEKVDTAVILQKKISLSGELKRALKRQEMIEMKKKFTVISRKKALFENLSQAFSKKGIVLKNNLSYYLKFFQKQINEKAAILGYQIKLELQNGLHVFIGKIKEQMTDLTRCSSGEKAIAIFLILDILNSITGIKLLFLDEIEILDNEVWKRLLSLIKEHEDEYDHIILAGVNHSDTIEMVKEIFS